jgi:hypothetical protein
MPSPQFIITSAGLAVASTAGPAGPYIEITKFRVGSGVGYTPTSADTALHGSMLYEGTPKGYNYVSDNTINVVCEIPYEIGTFKFGEVGVYLANGTLFALAAFDALQDKYSISSSGIPHVVRLNCHLKLAQSPAVFQITNLTQLNLLQVPSYQYLSPPSSMANQPNAVIVTEISRNNTDTLFIKQNDTEWTPVGWSLIRGFNARATQSSTTRVAVSEPTVTQNLLHYKSSYRNGQLLLRTQDGYVRKVIDMEAGSTTENGYFETFTKLVVDPPLPVVASNDYKFCTLYSDSSRPSLARPRIHALWEKLNRVIGPPYFDNNTTRNYVTNDGLGYGQTIVPPPNINSEPTLYEWNQLINSMKFYEGLSNPKATDHLVAYPGSAPGTPKYSISEYDSELNPYWHPVPEVAVVQLEEKINRITNNAGKIHKSNYGYIVARASSYTHTGTNAFGYLTTTAIINWGSNIAMTSYFNAGGYVDFTFKCTNSSYIEYLMRQMSTWLGPIRFSRFGVESMGPMRIKFYYGDGLSYPPGPLGLQGLKDGTEHLMFTYAIPVTPRGQGAIPLGGYGQVDNVILLSLFVTGNGNGNIRFRLNLGQSSSDHTYSYGATGRPANTTNLGLTVAQSDSGITAIEAEAGSYLSQAPDWASPAQKLNIYMLFGRPRDLVLNYPSVLSFTTIVNNGLGGQSATDITSTATASFGGGDTAIE